MAHAKECTNRIIMKLPVLVVDWNGQEHFLQQMRATWTNLALENFPLRGIQSATSPTRRWAR